jgi:ABC-2 type transport system ATP-binding protein
MNNIAISIKNLNKSYNYNKNFILENLSLDIPKGQISALIGYNGAGKSTLIKILTGLVKSFSGTIKIDNQDIKDIKINEKIGYMPQTDALYEDLTIIENIKFFADISGKNNKIEKIENIIKITELKEHENKLVSELSGGLKKRVSLACTLINDPDILILDEPTTALDLEIKHKIWNILKKLTNIGKTVIVSTHLMDEILYCQQYFLIKNGNIKSSNYIKNIAKSGKIKINCIYPNYSKSIITENCNILNTLKQININQDIKEINIDKEGIIEIISNIMKK